MKFDRSDMWQFWSALVLLLFVGAFLYALVTV